MVDWGHEAAQNKANFSLGLAFLVFGIAFIIVAVVLHIHWTEVAKKVKKFYRCVSHINPATKLIAILNVPFDGKKDMLGIFLGKFNSQGFLNIVPDHEKELKHQH